jgi:hypothetical protein
MPLRLQCQEAFAPCCNCNCNCNCNCCARTPRSTWPWIHTHNSKVAVNSSARQRSAGWHEQTVTWRALILCCPLMVSPRSLFINHGTVRNLQPGRFVGKQEASTSLIGHSGTAYAYVRKGKSGQPTSGSSEPPPHHSVSDSNNASATFPLPYTSHQIIQINKCGTQTVRHSKAWTLLYPQPCDEFTEKREKTCIVVRRRRAGLFAVFFARC